MNSDSSKVQPAATRHVLMEPGIWLVAGLCLKSMDWLLKPYAGGAVRMPLALAGLVLTAAGVVRMPIHSRAAAAPRVQDYGRGVVVGLLAGIALSSVVAARVYPGLHVLGLLGVALLLGSTIIAVRHRRVLERSSADRDPGDA